MRKSINILALFLFPFFAFSQINVNNNYPYNSAQYLVEDVLLGPCVNSSAHQFHGDPMQLGYFNGSNVSSSNFNFASGVILATGDVNVIDPSFIGPVFPPPNTVTDPDLLNVANLVPPLLPPPYTNSFNVSNINDVAILEFDFVAKSDSLSFNYVFGSSEYYMFENTPYNDVFGFFLSGPGINGTHSNNAINLANVPSSSPELPITISSVNEVTPINEQYFIDNRSGFSDIAYINGFTKSFTAKAALQIGQTYHIRLAIADGTDNNLNSFVWIEEGSFLSSNFSPSVSASISDNSCESFTDLTINLSQDNGEEDIDYAIFTSDGGSFNLSSLQNGDIIGNATINLSLTTFNPSLTVSNIISPNEIEVEAIDPVQGNLGTFTLKNLINGVEIYADSPDDLNNYTSGNSASITFNNLFQNPNNSTLWFNYDLYSELGCYIQKDQSFSIVNCPSFTPFASCSLSDDGCQALSDLTINVSQGSNEEDIDFATFSSDAGSFDLSSLIIGDNIGTATMNLSLVTFSADIIVSSIISVDEVEVNAVDALYGPIGSFVLKNLSTGGVEVFVDSPPDGNFYTNGNSSTITFNSLFQNPVISSNNPIIFSFDYTSELGSTYLISDNVYIDCCPFFAPEIAYTLADNYCVLTDLSINVIQYCNDEDISNANFTTNDGSFDFTTIAVGNVVGTGNLNLSSGSFLVNLEVSNIISSSEISLDAIEVSSGNILGSIILMNNIGGGVLIATDIFNDSPGDGDNYTAGSNSTIFLNNIFENPSNSNVLTFTSNLTSELASNDIQSFSFPIYCIPNIPRLNYTAINPSCPGLNDGRFDLSGYGGTGLYNYQILVYDSLFSSWISIGQSPISGTYTSNPVSFFNLYADCYMIIIEDDSGLSETTIICLNDPDSIQITELISYTTSSNNDGSIEILNIIGGTSPYVYSWIGPNGFTSNNQNIFNLENGTYTLTVNDDNSCSQDFVFLMEPLITGCTDTIANNYDQNANYDNGTCCYLNFYDDNIYLCLGQSVDLLYSNLGPIPDSYLWSTGDISSALAVSPNINTNYNLEVTTNGNVCSDSVSVTITCLSFSPFVSVSLSDLNCGLTDLTINVSQDPDEVDMDLSVFTSDAGTFNLSSLNISDNIGYASMSIGGMSVNADLFVSNIISTNIVEVEAINQVTNLLLGTFILENLSSGGIKIEVSSTGDGNLYTLNGNSSSVTFTNLFDSPNTGFLSFTSNIISELGDVDVQVFPMSLNCVEFSPTVSVSLSNTNCNQISDLSINVSQDPYEVDIDTAIFSSSGGNFLISAVNVGDVIGQATMNLNLSSFNSDIVVSNIVSSSFIIVEAIDQSNGVVLGTFTIENLIGGGVEIIALSPDDGNLYTNGNSSSLVFFNLFQNPNSSTVVFTSDISSELNNIFQDISPFVLTCAISPTVSVSLSDLNCGLTDLLITVSQDSNEVDIDSSFFSTNGGSFTMSSMNVGDIIGLATMDLSLNTFNADIIVDAIISSSEIEVKAIDQITGALLGYFTLKNTAGGGVEIIAISPDDGNTFTSGHTSSIIFYNVFLSPTVGFINFNSIIISETGDIDIQDTLIVLNCTSFSPNVIVSLSDLTCGVLADLTISVSQDSNEVDMDTAYFSSDAGSFTISTMNIGDTIGSSSIVLSLNSYSADLIVTNIISLNEIIVEAFDQISGLSLGTFSLENLVGGGIQIIAISPDDGNLFTNGNSSVVTFSNVFLTSTSGLLTFTSEIISELGDVEISTSGFAIGNITSFFTIFRCDTYTWNGNVFDTTGIYVDTMSSIIGCDSIVTLNLTIYNSTTSFDTVSVCNSYLWNGTLYETSGNYIDTMMNNVGCDSVMYLNLTVNSTSSLNVLTVCDSISWNGNVYDSTGLYIDTIPNSVLCDSVITLDLIVNFSSNSQNMVTVCDSINWNGIKYDSSGIYIDTLTNLVGCDSIVILDLTVNYTTFVSDTLYACDSLVWNGNVYDTNGVYTDTLLSSVGCDSIVTIDLIVNSSSSSSNSITVCDSLIWHGLTLTTSGIYDTILTNVAGCDSFTQIYLTIIPSVYNNLYEHSCGSFIFNGVSLDSTGIYYDTLVSASGCDSVIVLDLVVTPNVEIAVNITDVACSGDSTGEIDLTLLDGSPAFTFQWSNGAVSEDIVNLLGDSIYNCVIVDSAGCILDTSFFIYQPNLLTVSENIINVSCFNGDDGSIVLNISGGVIPYNISWGAIDTLNVSAGLYSYLVTDSNGCVVSDSVEVTQPNPLGINVNTLNIQCYGQATGFIEIGVIPGAGTPGYTYEWIGPNLFSSFSNNIYDLYAGDYNLILTDSNSCQFDTIITLTQPVNLPQFTDIQLSDYSGFNIRCKGENSGWVSVVVTGGYEPYTYLWSNSETTDSIYDLFADTYILEVTDSLGCIIVFEFPLIEPAEDLSSNIIPTTNYNGYNISCYGFNDASIFGIASGGVPNYRYFWDGIQSIDTLTDLTAGDYELTIKDQNNCISISNITLIQPDSLFIDIVTFTDTCSKGVGLGEISVFGGVTPYSFLWSNGSTLQTVTDFSEGNYQVVVSDINLCEFSDSIYIENLPSPIIDFGILPDNQRLFDQIDDPIVFVDYTDGIWQDIVSWIWDFDDGAFGSDSIAYHSYDSEGLYQVMLTTISEYNCIDTLTKPLIISDYNLYIPNAFTPFSTDDEYNDIFKAYGIGIVSFKMDIYDRWGGKIFTSNSLDIGWDGTTEKSNQVPVGIYMYNIVAENVYGEIFKHIGQVKLLR
jgi:gliding motility-associated-like protein